MSNLYKVVLVICCIMFSLLSLMEYNGYNYNYVDKQVIFQHTPQNKYENAVIAIYSKAQQLKVVKQDSQKVDGANLEKSKTKWLTFHATYYGHDCNGCSGITATGINVQNSIYFKDLRIVAVDPTIIPLGSIVEIQTPNERFKAIAADKGGAIKGRRLDILVESEYIAAQYGRHDMQLFIIQ